MTRSVFIVYIVECSDGSYYTGHTDDVERQLAAHQQGTFRGYTYSRRPVELVWCGQFETRDDAFARERQIKGWSRRKQEALIASDWDRLRRPAQGDGSTGSP